MRACNDQGGEEKVLEKVHNGRVHTCSIRYSNIHAKDIVTVSK